MAELVRAGPARAAADRQSADRRAVRRPHACRRTRRRPSWITSGPVPIIPSVPATLEALQASATAILNKIAKLPVEQLVASLSKTAGGAGADRQLAGCSEGPRRRWAHPGAAAADHRPGRLPTPGRCWAACNAAAESAADDAARRAGGDRLDPAHGRLRLGADHQCGEPDAGADPGGALDPRVRRLSRPPSRGADSAARPEEASSEHEMLRQPAALAALVLLALLGRLRDDQADQLLHAVDDDRARRRANIPAKGLVIGLGPLDLPQYLDRPDIVTRAGRQPDAAGASSTNGPSRSSLC